MGFCCLGSATAFVSNLETPQNGGRGGGGVPVGSSPSQQKNGVQCLLLKSEDMFCGTLVLYYREQTKAVQPACWKSLRMFLLTILKSFNYHLQSLGWEKATTICQGLGLNTPPGRCRVPTIELVGFHGF